MRANAGFQPSILEAKGIVGTTHIVAPDGVVFDRFPLWSIEARHEVVIDMALTLGEVPPLSGAIASWPAWFAAAWLRVRWLLKRRDQEVARG